MYEVTFEIYVEDKLTNKQTAKAPKQMLIASFVQTAEQILKEQKPMKIKMIRPVTIWDSIEQKQKTLNNEVELSNDAMKTWESGKGE